MDPIRTSFHDLTESERARIADAKGAREFRVSREAAGLDALGDRVPDASSDEWLEVPPSPVVLDDRAAGAVYALSPANTRGDWQRFVVHVYRAGGRIRYRQYDARDVLVRIEFEHFEH